MNYDRLLTHAQKLLESHGKPDSSSYTGDRRSVTFAPLTAIL
jgi:hypothetical protein